MRGLGIHRHSEVASGLRAVLLANRAALLKFLLARRVPPDEAEDLLQELYVKLESQPIGPVAHPQAYLYRMADNLLLDRRYSATRRAGREEAWVMAQSGTNLGTDDRPSAEQALLARERLAIVATALGELPERTLLVFRMFRIDEVPQKAIAAQLGISVSAVEKHLQKAYRAVVEARVRLDADAAPPHRQ